MVDSNIQREKLLPSEKAFAYKMRLEALNHQGKTMDNDYKGIERYSRMKTEESKEIAEALKHIFEKCGFSKIGEAGEYYAVSTEYLRDQAVKRKVVDEEMFWLWEHT